MCAGQMRRPKIPESTIRPAECVGGGRVGVKKQNKGWGKSLYDKREIMNSLFWFRLGREGFNHSHTSSSNYEDRVKALLANEEKVFPGIPSIEKKITGRVRKFLSFKLFDLFWYTLHIKSPITCIQGNQFLTQKNRKHFIDISIVSKCEDFL